MNPILLAGGSGLVGRWAAHHLRAQHPQLPILIGGRDLAKAQATAERIGEAEAVLLDSEAEDLGLGDRPVAAVATLYRDSHLAALRFAQSRGAGHISISAEPQDIAPEVAAYMHDPGRAPVVLGTEWLVGATTIPALQLASQFARIEDIRIAAVLDVQDTGGPEQVADLERLTDSAPMVLERRNGVYAWHAADAEPTLIHAVDGTDMQASPISPNDVVTLGTVTNARNISFSLAEGLSSTRRQGGPMSTEVIVEMAGDDTSGQPLRLRQAVVHPQGQMSPTGLGVAMVLERLAGLDGAAPAAAGLYFPSQLLDADTYLERLARTGGQVLQLDPAA